MARIEPFEKHSEQYEAWFDAFNAVYESELRALSEVVPLSAHGVEIGVGSGLFAAPLGIGEGVEPSEAMAKRARDRGIEVEKGVAEELPLKSESYDFALMVTTICFVDDPEKSVREMMRILKPRGKVIIGFVDLASPLGEIYRLHKDEDPFYRHATFYTADQILRLLTEAGLVVERTLQTVFGALKEIERAQDPRDGHGEGGFVVIVASRPS
mgnify:FL=1